MCGDGFMLRRPLPKPPDLRVYGLINTRDDGPRLLNVFGLIRVTGRSSAHPNLASVNAPSIAAPFSLVFSIPPIFPAKLSACPRIFKRRWGRPRLRGLLCPDLNERR